MEEPLSVGPPCPRRLLPTYYAQNSRIRIGNNSRQFNRLAELRPHSADCARAAGVFGSISSDTPKAIATA